MKIVSTFSFSHDAQILRSALEGNGIEAFVRDEYTAEGGCIGIGLGGVKVEVADDDWPKAMEVLSSKIQSCQGRVRRVGKRRYLLTFTICAACIMALWLFRLEFDGLKDSLGPVVFLTLFLSGAFSYLCAPFKKDRKAASNR